MTNATQRPLGVRSAAVLHTIRTYVAKYGYPPTTMEIASAVGLGPGSVPHHLGVLHQRGYIVTEPGVARGIRVLRPGPVLHVVPGGPIEPEPVP